MNKKLFDAHIHFSSHYRYTEFEQCEHGRNVARWAIVSLPDKRRINFNPEALYAKMRRPAQCYALLSFDYSAVWDGYADTAPDFAGQLDELVKLGIDGLKLWDGKPSFQADTGIAPDSPLFDAAFAAAAAHRLPVTLHVADPPIFWRQHAEASGERGVSAPGVAAEGYDESVPSYEELLAQAERLVARHRQLTVIFPHLLFLAGDLGRLARFLDSYQNAYLDLSPGLYFYPALSAQRDEARRFFSDYAERILLGTDGFWFGPEVPWLPQSAAEANVKRLTFLLSFLSSDEGLPNPFGPAQRNISEVQGLNLSETTLAPILAGNAKRLFGVPPRALDRAALLSYCTRFLERLRQTEADDAHCNTMSDLLLELQRLQ